MCRLVNFWENLKTKPYTKLLYIYSGVLVKEKMAAIISRIGLINPFILQPPPSPPLEDVILTHDWGRKMGNRYGFPFFNSATLFLAYCSITVPFPSSPALVKDLMASSGLWLLA